MLSLYPHKSLVSRYERDVYRASNRALISGCFSLYSSNAYKSLRELNQLLLRHKSDHPVEFALKLPPHVLRRVGLVFRGYEPSYLGYKSLTLQQNLLRRSFWSKCRLHGISDLADSRADEVGGLLNKLRIGSPKKPLDHDQFAQKTPPDLGCSTR